MTLLCVHAHPDDEAIWTGGLLAANPGSTVLTCTYAPGSVRAGELERSLEILGAAGPRLLGYGDRDDPRFQDAPYGELVGQVVEAIREVRPRAVVTYDAFGGYGHPDHILAHRITLAAVEAAGYPQLYPGTGEPWRPAELWQATFPSSFVSAMAEQLLGGPPGPDLVLPGTPDELVNEAVDIRGQSAAKWAAMLAHDSEVRRGGSLTMLTSLPEPLRERLLSTEWYIRRPLRAE